MDNLRATLRDDPFARATTQILLLLIVTLCTIWTVLLGTLVALTPDLPAWGEYLVDNLLPKFNPLRESFVTTVVTALITAAPVALAATCYITNRARKRLNAVGRISLVLSVIGAIASLLILVVLRPPSDWVLELGKKEVIATLASSVEVTGRACVFYVAVLIGIGGYSEDKQ